MLESVQLPGDSWSFSEGEAQTVVRKRVVDDGSIVIDDDQMEGQYNAARDALFDSKKPRITKKEIDTAKQEAAEKKAEKKRAEEADASKRQEKDDKKVHEYNRGTIQEQPLFRKGALYL